MDRKATAEDEQRALTMLIVNRAIALVGKQGVPLEIVAQELTAAAACGQVKLLGRETAAHCLRELADNIEAGAFDGIAGEPMRH